MSPRPVSASAVHAVRRVTGTCERTVEPALALDGRARQPVRPARASGDRQRGLGVVVGDGPLERATDVVLLAVDRDEPRALSFADVRSRRAGAQPGEVRRHRVADPLRVAPLGELLAAVLRQRLQLREADAVAGGNGEDERLLDQRVHDVGEVGRVERLVGADGLGRRQVAAAGEHRQPLEHPLLVVEQQLVAPVDDGAQRLLPRQRRPGAAGEQAEPIVEAGRDLLDRERTRAGRGELDGERQPVEAGADLRHRREDVVGQPRRRRPGRGR